MHKQENRSEDPVKSGKGEQSGICLVRTDNDGPKGDWKMTVEEFSFSGCHYNSSCD